MSSPFTISDEELNSDQWAKAREMCERYSWDIHEIAAGIARFRMTRAEARAQALREATVNLPTVAAPAPATLVNFHAVRHLWNPQQQRWARPNMVYIGRSMPHLNIQLPESPFANPFRIEKDTDNARENAIELYADWLLADAQAHLLHQLDSLRGKILVCWCCPRRCHGDILLQLMREKASYAEVLPEIIEPVTEDWPAEWQPALKLNPF